MKMMNSLLALTSFLVLMFWWACSPKMPIGNPPATGFNATQSDQKAIKIADEVMAAMGGRTAWDQTHYLVWNFFGARKLYWDKWTGKVRVESEKDNYTVVVNIHDGTGMVKKDGEIMENRDSLSKYLTMAKNVWINDSYWLVMPFKLKDSGVTLKYVDERNNTAGALSDVLELTFSGVGETPDNKYHVFVDKTSRLVTEWSFFPNYTDEKARFSTPWTDYQTHGKIQLSSGRGTYELTEIGVYETLPEALFTTLEPVNY